MSLLLWSAACVRCRCCFACHHGRHVAYLYSSPALLACLLQSFSAGVGNWVADEVLYQVGLPLHCAGCRVPCMA